MTIDTLINKLEEARKVHGGDTGVELENFTTTTTTATEDLLKNVLVPMKTNVIKIILSFDSEIGEIKLTPIEKVVMPLAD
tara:strand:+ start:400 stop:639 length:240 start_codon:yes stop_codon:yes gene_type:complete